MSYETIRFWWNRFGPLFAAEIRKRLIHHCSFSNHRWHLDEVFVRINGETHYLWRAVDHPETGRWTMDKQTGSRILTYRSDD